MYSRSVLGHVFEQLHHCSMSFTVLFIRLSPRREPRSLLIWEQFQVLWVDYFSYSAEPIQWYLGQYQAIFQLLKAITCSAFQEFYQTLTQFQLANEVTAWSAKSYGQSFLERLTKRRVPPDKSSWIRFNRDDCNGQVRSVTLFQNHSVTISCTNQILQTF